jgi:uncharacterized protein (DUF1697 family)
MTVHVALLRAVNLGSHKAVAMADLRKLFTDLEFEDVRTLLNSGNVVFRSDAKPEALEHVLEKEAAERLGLDTEFFVRTAAQWNAIVKANPFPAEAKRDPAHLLLTACKKPVGKNVKATGVKREVFRTNGREIYIVYPDGVGRSRLKLDVVGTARNWNTVLKLADLMKEI